MRRFMWPVALGSLLLASMCCAQATSQPWPTRPVTILVTAAAGGVTDVVARAIGQRLSVMWRQPVLIENKGGAGHIIGAQAVARAAPDGYTLLVAEAGTFVLNPTLYSNERLGYDVAKGLTPITGLVRINQAIVATNDLPVANIKELIALARQKPGQLTYGTASIGSAPHMNMLKLENMTGIKLQAVHYRGAAPALNDVMAGHIKLMSISTSLVEQPFRAHRLKILAIGSMHRMPKLEEVPTVAESGVPGYEAATWFGLAATGGTPQDIVMKIDADVRKVMDDPVFRAQFMDPQMFESMATTPDQFRAYVDSEIKSWAKIIREEHLTID
ncbi:MAG TPA: tripartite tricarboxylate transporter substrate binding protein [Xanthobacteraceae bacterium]|nr:tripartite tricarboxylate transporter substrate binding protein [Xanthobacteraceae bacterium]